MCNMTLLHLVLFCKSSVSHNHIVDPVNIIIIILDVEHHHMTHTAHDFSLQWSIMEQIHLNYSPDHHGFL